GRMGELKSSPVGFPVVPTLCVSPPDDWNLTVLTVSGLQFTFPRGAQNTSKAVSTPDSHVVFLCPEFLVYDRVCG
ncbi:hypothetical protein ACXN2E_004101, partial [Shigella sonnei]